MKCVICHGGRVDTGLATLTFDSSGSVVVVRDVPARVCQTCGERYVDDTTAEPLLRLVKEAEARGDEVTVVRFHAA